MSASYIPQTGQWLARFRADPYLVRVSVRRVQGGWRASVSSRESTHVEQAVHQDPELAVIAALAIAEHKDMPGIDIGMGYAYNHPFSAILSASALC